ncbi:hypothetical protein B0H19DRAFT_1071600 [Mycena capillaripes]|nr:hypothetical protein B0H19DRAFT_1071600 [Mycena capillaripes]
MAESSCKSYFKAKLEACGSIPCGNTGPAVDEITAVIWAQYPAVHGIGGFAKSDYRTRNPSTRTRDTATAQSALAVACAREFPWVYLALGKISEIAWGPHPDKHQGYLLHLPCDQLIFLAALTEMMSLQPDLTIFFEKPMANLANAWVDHCDFG